MFLSVRIYIHLSIVLFMYDVWKNLTHNFNFLRKYNVHSSLQLRHIAWQAGTRWVGKWVSEIAWSVIRKTIQHTNAYFTLNYGLNVLPADKKGYTSVFLVAFVITEDEGLRYFLYLNESAGLSCDPSNPIATSVATVNSLLCDNVVLSYRIYIICSRRPLRRNLLYISDVHNTWGGAVSPPLANIHQVLWDAAATASQ